MSFFSEWFGSHAGREVFYADRKTREFIETPKQLEAYVQESREKHIPAFTSVQPYKARGELFGLEKLFYDFDSKGELNKAWKDASTFLLALEKYYSVKPLIVFSGQKGYHVYVFLSNCVLMPTFHEGFLKNLYGDVQKRILKGLNFETLDKGVIGDIKRLSRVPYSIHEKTGKLCQPLNLNREPIQVSSLDEYRENGLPTKLLEVCGSEILKREKQQTYHRKTFFKHSGKIRPCLEAALSLSLNKGEGHKMRLAIATEYLNKGFSVPQIVDLFHSQVDFSEEKTRYFVEDAQKKGYKPFKCATIRELGYCLGASCSLSKRMKEIRTMIGGKTCGGRKNQRLDA